MEDQDSLVGFLDPRSDRPFPGRETATPSVLTDLNVGCRNCEELLSSVSRTAADPKRMS